MSYSAGVSLTPSSGIFSRPDLGENKVKIVYCLCSCENLGKNESIAGCRVFWNHIRVFGEISRQSTRCIFSDVSASSTNLYTFGVLNPIYYSFFPISFRNRSISDIFRNVPTLLSLLCLHKSFAHSFSKRRVSFDLCNLCSFFNRLTSRLDTTLVS